MLFMNSALTRLAFYSYFYNELYVPFWFDGVRLASLSKLFPEDGVFLLVYESLLS